MSWARASRSPAGRLTIGWRRRSRTRAGGSCSGSSGIRRRTSRAGWSPRWWTRRAGPRLSRARTYAPARSRSRMTALLSIVHQPNAGPGVFADGVSDVVEWVPSAGPPPTLDGLSAAMVFGGAMHVDQHSTHPWLRGEKQLIRELLNRRVPVLGVCLGAQLLAEAAGSQARRALQPEIGWHRGEVTPAGGPPPPGGSLAAALPGAPLHSPLSPSFQVRTTSYAWAVRFRPSRWWRSATSAIRPRRALAWSVRSARSIRTPRTARLGGCGCTPATPAGRRDSSTASSGR